MRACFTHHLRKNMKHTNFKLPLLGLFGLFGMAALSACSPQASNEEIAAQVKIALAQEKAAQTAQAEQAAEVATQVAAQVKLALADERAKLAATAKPGFPPPKPHAETSTKPTAQLAQAVAHAPHAHASAQAPKPTLSKPAAASHSSAPTVPVVAATKPTCGDCGVVLAIHKIEEAGKGSGLGVVGGGVVGGLLGNQVGAGTGKDLATLAGAIGGAIAGNAIEKNAKKTIHYDIVVRMDDGVEHRYREANQPSVSVGQKIKIKDDKVVLP
jgi:outer membrane lipoprotein SlyB